MREYDFELDRFQIEAVQAVADGESVLVSAPTGAGKTVIAEAAVERALGLGGKAFYTTPIKALSNQKFTDLVGIYGADRVGLLTGDTSVHGEADIVVMTTEVLRNMLYERSRTLDGLQVVILDEIHYLQDPARGPVWEEIVINLPASVRLVGLSATVSNADELAGWIEALRGPTRTVIETERPVALHNHYLAQRSGASAPTLIPTLTKSGKPNPEGRAMDNPRLSGSRRGGSSRSQRSDDGRSRRATYRAPRRLAVLDLLEEEKLLPAIYFIFSRAACDDAAADCYRSGVRLTDKEERGRIARIIERRVANLSPDDLRTLGFHSWREQLIAGIGVHHAGLVPPFKEAVEECFVSGLTRVVFATETLALGINMPARSVVIEKPTKYNGERHELLTPSSYAQITGRAGRRGIDDVGHAIVLWSPFVEFDRVAELAASRTYHLQSAFRPTYNMAVNLVSRYDRGLAHEMVNRSFAQYQLDSSLRRTRERLETAEREIAQIRADLGPYADHALAAAGSAQSRSNRGVVEQALARLRPGSIVGHRGSPVVVLSTAQRSRGATRLKVMTHRGTLRSLGASDFDHPPVEEDHVELPLGESPSSDAVRSAAHDALARQPEAVEAAANGDPLAGLADRRRLLHLGRQLRKAEEQAAKLARRVERQDGSMVRRLDRVLEVLEDGGYVDEWQVTSKGELLRKIYHESDLLVAEAACQGLFDGLSSPEIAALASCFAYEARAGADRRPTYPTAEVRARAETAMDICAELNGAEDDLGLPATRPPDPGLAEAAFGWASGAELGEVLEDELVTAGDFVRHVRQLIDLLRQLGEVLPGDDDRRSARRAAEQVRRGVVEDSSTPTAAGPGRP